MRYQIIKAGIKKNKSRSFIILFCLSISIGMVTASFGFVSQLIEALEGSQRIYSGNSDIIITNGENTSKSAEVKQLLEYEVTNHNINAAYKNNQKMLRVFAQEDLTKCNIVEFNQLKKLKSNEIIVSDKFLEEIKQDIGEELTITILSKKYQATIGGTFKSPNQFTNEAYKDFFFTTYEAWDNEIINASYTTMERFVKVKEEKDKQTALRYFENQYKPEYVREAFNEQDFTTKYDGVMAMLTLVSISIAIMSISIIYTTKKLLILIDSKQYGILRSMGGNKHYIKSILLMEGTFYGILSGIISIFISNLITYSMLKIILGKDFIQGLQINRTKAILIVIISVIISCIVNLIASKEIRKQSIKNVLLNEFNKKSRKLNKTPLIWLIILILNIILMITTAKKLPTSAVVIFMLISILSGINIIPKIAKKLITILQNSIQRIFGNTGYLAIKSSQASNSFISNVTILTVSIGIVLLINSTLTSIADNSIITMQENLAYDIIIPEMVKEEDYERILSLNEIESGYQFTDINNVEILKKDTTIYSVDFIHTDYHKYRKFDIEEETYQLLYENNNKMILSEKILNQLELQIGDTINLKILDKEVPFEIVASFITAMNNGDYAIVSYNEIPYYTETYFKLKNNQNQKKVIAEINQIRNKPQDNTVQKDEYIEQQISNATQIYQTIRYISIIPIIVSIIIYLTNGLFSFYENKRSLLIYRSMGISKSRLKKIFLLEQYICAAMGCIFGAIFGNLLIEQVKIYMRASSSTMHIAQSLTISALIIVITIIFASITTFIISTRLFKIPLINELRSQ